MVYKNRKFDLNKKPATFCCDEELNKDNLFDDTTLRLECFGNGRFSREKTRPQDSKSVPNGGGGLVVGVGPASSLNERDLVLKLGLSGCSSASKSDMNSVSDSQSSLVDEGSSAKSSGGYMPSLLLAPRISVPLKKLRLNEPKNVHDGKRRLAPGSTNSARGRSVLLVPHGGMVQESKETNNDSLGIAPRLLHGLMASPGPGSSDNNSLSGLSADSNPSGWLEKPAKRRQMIPPQVLVPSSMKSSSGFDNNGDQESLERVVLEDRVHGGRLLSLLMGSNRGN